MLINSVVEESVVFATHKATVQPALVFSEFREAVVGKENTSTRRTHLVFYYAMAEPRIGTVRPTMAKNVLLAKSELGKVRLSFTIACKTADSRTRGILQIQP